MMKGMNRNVIVVRFVIRKIKCGRTPRTTTTVFADKKKLGGIRDFFLHLCFYVFLLILACLLRDGTFLFL